MHFYIYLGIAEDNAVTLPRTRHTHISIHLSLITETTVVQSSPWYLHSSAKTIRANYQKCILGAAGSDAISFYLRDITFRSPRNSISRTSRRRVAGFSICSWRKKEAAKREQGSVLRLERRWTKREGGQERRQTAHENRHGIFHIPQGNYWQSARKWRRKYHVGGPRTLWPLLADLPFYQAPPSCASSRVIPFPFCFLRASV